MIQIMSDSSSQISQISHNSNIVQNFEDKIEDLTPQQLKIRDLVTKIKSPKKSKITDQNFTELKKAPRLNPIPLNQSHPITEPIQDHFMILKKVMAISIFRGIFRHFDFSYHSYAPGGFLWGRLPFPFQHISKFRFWMNYLILLMVCLSLFITTLLTPHWAYNLSFPLLGIASGLLHTLEFVLVLPYRTYSNLEMVTLSLTLIKHFSLLAMVCFDWSILGLLTILLSAIYKAILYHQLHEHKENPARFFGRVELMVEFFLLLGWMQYIGILNWQLSMGMPCILAFVGLVSTYVYYSKKLKIQQKNLIRTQKGRYIVAILWITCFLVLDALILSTKLDKINRSKMAFKLVVFSEILFIFGLLALAVILYLSFLKIDHKVGELNFNFIKPCLNQKVIVDDRNYIKLRMDWDKMTIQRPSFLDAFPANLVCSSCGEANESRIYHCPGPCLHELYCVNCAMQLMYRVKTCLICNKGVQRLYRLDVRLKSAIPIKVIKGGIYFDYLV